MKKFTKLLGIVLIIALVMSMGITAAFAAGTHSVTISAATGDTASHTYGAYQIFAGKTETIEMTDSTNDIEETVFGDAVVGHEAAFITALKTLGSAFAGLTETSTAAQVTGAIYDYAENGVDTDPAKALADVIGQYIEDEQISANYTTTNRTFPALEEGYYFFKDEKDIAAGETGAQTRFILDVVKDWTITEKASVPSVEKKVDDKNDSNVSEDAVSWGETADYDVGDTIPYQITGTLASTFNDYDWYSYKFTDTMQHLTYVNGSARVYAYGYEGNMFGGNDLVSVPIWCDVTDAFDISYTNHVLTVTAKGDKGLRENVFSNGYAYLSGTAVEMDYTAFETTSVEDIDAALTVPETVALDPTVSKIVLRYDATLDSDAVVKNVNEVKLEFSNNPNPGGEGDKGTTPPDTSIVFTYNVVVNKTEKNTNGTDPNATKPLTGADFALFKKYTTANAEAENKTAATMPTAGVTAAQWALDDGYIWVAVGDAVKSAKDGVADSVFAFNRLDDGEYMLVETVTPSGYNTIAPQKFTVTASDDGTVLTSLAGTAGSDAIINMTEDLTTGTLSTDVLNNSGTVLPSTGGIGTTIFYVVGSILVVAAGVLLITKKRMSREG